MYIQKDNNRYYHQHDIERWLFPNYGFADPPPLLKSDYLDIKDAECAKKMMAVKYHIAFGRCGRPKLAFWTPKNSTSFKSVQLLACRSEKF